MSFCTLYLVATLSMKKARSAEGHFVSLCHEFVNGGSLRNVPPTAVGPATRTCTSASFMILHPSSYFIHTFETPWLPDIASIHFSLSLPLWVQRAKNV